LRLDLPGLGGHDPVVMVNPLGSGLFKTLLEMGAEIEIANTRTVGGEPVADITAGPRACGRRSAGRARAFDDR
jgi:hypothetical protein